MNKFAKRLKDLRKKHNWSQKQAATQLGISQALLSHYENGIRECGLDFLMRAANIFDCTTDYLLGLSSESAEKGVLLDTDNITADLKTSPRLNSGRKSALQALNLLYSITARIGNGRVQSSFNKVIFSRVYFLARMLEGKYFDSEVFKTDSAKSLLHAEAQSATSLVEFLNRFSDTGLEITMNSDHLSDEYPSSFNALSEIISYVENRIN